MSVSDFSDLITDDVIQIYEDAEDALINTLGKNCILYYPPVQIPCGCTVDNIGARPGNFGGHGGQVPFSELADCPLCNGTGFKTEVPTESINLIVYFNPKDFTYIGNVQIPDGVVQTKGYFTDFPKIQQAESILIDNSIQGLNPYRFVKFREPIPVGLKRHRYCITFWKRS